MLLIALVVIIVVVLVFITRINIKRGGRENTDLDDLKLLTKNIPAPIKDIYTKLVKKVYNSKKSKPLVMFDDIPESLPYVEGARIYSTDNHFGQRKLFLNEVQFLTKNMEPSVCVYVGAAPSNKGAFLASLFPDVKFIMIDPNPFDIKPYGNIKVETIPIENELINDEDVNVVVEKAFESNSNICIINGFMTIPISKAIGKYVEKHPVPLYFVSDIRTNMEEAIPTTLDIVWNSAQQYNWIRHCNPKASMLKFRCPFFNESDEEIASYSEKIKTMPYKDDFEEALKLGADFEKVFKTKELVYFDGDVYLQPWAPVSSTETRLVIEDYNKPLIPYPFKNYEESLFYYNKISRNFQMFENVNANKKIGFDHCADCALENTIWSEYLEGKGEKVTQDKVAKFVEIISKIIQRPLLNTNSLKHPGTLFKPIDDLPNRLELYNKVCHRSKKSSYAKQKNKHRDRL